LKWIESLDHQRGAADAAIVYVNTEPAKGEKALPQWS